MSKHSTRMHVDIFVCIFFACIAFYYNYRENLSPDRFLFVIQLCTFWFILRILVHFFPLLKTGMPYLILLAGYGVSKSVNGNADLSLLALSNVEALANDEATPFCYSGGPGAYSCSIDAGVRIAGVGVAGGCSVGCREEYYACCSLRCTCISN